MNKAQLLYKQYVVKIINITLLTLLVTFLLSGLVVYRYETSKYNYDLSVLSKVELDRYNDAQQRRHKVEYDYHQIWIQGINQMQIMNSLKYSYDHYDEQIKNLLKIRKAEKEISSIIAENPDMRTWSANTLINLGILR